MDIASLKSKLHDERKALHARLLARPSGRDGARILSRLRDEALLGVFEANDPPPGIALAALGGYGREQVAPYSDTDIVLLYAKTEDEPVASAFATRFVQAVWDLGLEPGHALRSLDDAARTLTRDLVSATALIDARRLAGSPEVFASFEASRDDFLARFGDQFLRAKFDEADARHAKYGGTPLVAEPNVKLGMGGLRDAELLRLFERTGGATALVDHERRLDVEYAEERLLEVRLLLHLFEKKKQDRLSFDLGPRIARALGFRDSRDSSAVEHFMADTFRSVKAIDRALSLARHSVAERWADRGGFAPERRPRRLGERLVAVGDVIELAREDAFRDADLVAAFELFLFAQREKLAPSEPLLEAVRRLLPRVTQAERENPKLSALLLEILSGKNRVAAALRAMHRSGLLGEFLPELGTLDGLWQSDPYHEFTVDEHSLRCVEALEGFAHSPEREDQLRAEILGQLRRPDILRLGVLLHDMGKGKGGAHVEVGTAMVPEVVRRLGLPLEEGRLLRFLVEHHLEMSRMIEQRDMSSPSTLGHFCEVVGDEERLDMLYLLTVADMRGVGARTFPRWKDALLTSLRELARERFRGAERKAIGAAERRKEILARLPRGLAEADLDRHLELAPRRYQLEVEPFDVVLHLRLIRDLEGGKDPTTAHVVEGPLRHFWVCTRDRPGLFAKVAGVLAARGASIVSADAYTRRDGTVLDRLTLAISPELEGDDEYWQGLDALLTDVLSGGRRIEDVVAAARTRVPYREAPATPAAATVVKISNKLSDRYTVIDVGIEDRIGLLYDLAHRITELGLDIHYAKISTRATRATDVFYVTRDGGKVESPAELEAIQTAIGET